MRLFVTVFELVMWGIMMLELMKVVFKFVVSVSMMTVKLAVMSITVVIGVISPVAFNFMVQIFVMVSERSIRVPLFGWLWVASMVVFSFLHLGEVG